MSAELVDDLVAYGDWLVAQLGDPIRSQPTTIVQPGVGRAGVRTVQQEKPAHRQPRRWATIAAAVLVLAGTAAFVGVQRQDRDRPSVPSASAPATPSTSATAMVTVPDIVGLTLDDVLRRLSDLGLVAMIMQIDDRSVAFETVTSIAPTAGTEVKAGSTVELEVAIYPGGRGPLDYATTEHTIPLWPDLSTSDPRADTSAYGLDLCSSGAWTKYASLTSEDRPDHTYQGTICPLITLKEMRPQTIASCAAISDTTPAVLYARCQRRTDSSGTNGSGTALGSRASDSTRSQLASFPTAVDVNDTPAFGSTASAAHQGLTSNDITLRYDDYLKSVCFNIELAEGDATGCVDEQLLSSGLAYGAFQNGTGDIAVVGIVPDDVTTVEIAGRTLVPTGNTWRTTVPPSTKFEITVHSADGIETTTATHQSSTTP